MLEAGVPRPMPNSEGGAVDGAARARRQRRAPRHARFDRGRHRHAVDRRAPADGGRCRAVGGDADRGAGDAHCRRRAGPSRRHGAAAARAREPVARIIGERAFYGRDFAITEATLDPRPDSETLITAALELADAHGWRDKPIRIVDVGTGSGCLLVTLLAELPQATGTAVDINADALRVAAENARRHGVMSRMHAAMSRRVTRHCRAV